MPEKIFRYAVTGENSRVTRLGGIEVDSALDSGGRLNLKSSKLGLSDEFFRVAISPEFGGGSVNCVNVADDFELGGIVELEVISYGRLVAMRDRYYSDYEGLREDLGVSPVFDFAIVPEEMSEVSMEPEGGVSGASEVLAKDYVLKVLKSDGSLSNERVSFRIW